MKRRVRLKPEEIEIGERMRQPVDEEAVKSIASSIEKIGLQNPISVYFKNDVLLDDGAPVNNVPFLAAGLHRLKALIKLGTQFVECDVFETEREARMWEISENLHRSDLDRMQRALHEAEWIRLAEEEALVSGQLDQKLSSRGRKNEGRPEGGLAKAARELPVKGDTEEARRANLRRDLQIASVAPEALDEARRAGLADNQDALLKIARAPAGQQIAKVHEITERKASGIDRDLKLEAAENMARWLSEHSDASQWEWIKSTLYTAGAKAVADAFVNETGAGAPVMSDSWS